jgi:hypothetical protein
VGLTQDYYEAFCMNRSPQPLFCSDFDEGSGQSGWGYSHNEYGTVAAETGEFTSYPAAMRAQSIATPNGPVNVAVYKAFSLTGQTFSGTLDLDLRVDQADSGCAQAVIAQIGFSNPNVGDYWVQLVVTSPGGAPLTCSVNEVGGNFASHALVSGLDVATWTHVTLQVTTPLTVGGMGQASIAFNGTPVSMNKEPIGLSVPFSSTEQTLGVGITWASTPSAGWTVVYDNVVFNATTS